MTKRNVKTRMNRAHKKYIAKPIWQQEEEANMALMGLKSHQCPWCCTFRSRSEVMRRRCSTCKTYRIEVLDDGIVLGMRSDKVEDTGRLKQVKA